MFLCIDIGGTKTLIAAFSRRGRVVRRRKFATPQGYKMFIQDLTENLSHFRRYKIKEVVVAIPGIVQKNYTVSFGNRSWKNIDLVTPIKNLFDCPIWFENDANLAALYEGYRIPGRTVFLTFSTGIGGGIVKNNRILPESDKLEPGHKKYEYQGKTLEWEDIASANAIGSAYHIDRATALRGKIIMQDIANRVALGLTDIIDECHPDTIVLGGPLGKIFKLYGKYLPEDLEVKIRRPKRPTESVIYGEYIYAKQKERE